MNQNNKCGCQNNFSRRGNSCISNQNYTRFESSYPSIRQNSSITYNNIINNTNNSSISINSDTFIYNLQESSYLCIVEKNEDNCQKLVNLCLLSLANVNHPSCLILTQYSNTLNQYSNIDTGFRIGLPWFFYNRSFNEIINSTSLDKVYSTNNIQNNKLNLKLVTYDFNGKILSQENFSNQLAFCSNFNYNFDRTVGDNYNWSCKFNLNYFFKKEYLLNYPQRFYELYIEDSDTKIFHIPVILNQLKRRSNIELEQVNTDNYKFVNRFFIVDRLSGLVNNNDFITNKNPEYIRIADYISLKIIVKNDNSNKIYLPYLQLNYIVFKNPFNSILNYNLNFNVGFSLNDISFLTALIVIISIIALFSIIKAIYQTNTFIKRNPNTEHHKRNIISLIFEFIYELFHTFSTYSFIIIFCFCGYKFFILKFQGSLYGIISDEISFFEDYNEFILIFYVIFILKLISVLIKIFLNSNYDIYFIDWEIPNFLMNSDGHQKKINSAWRIITIANQFNELNSQFLINHNFASSILIFLQVGFNIVYAGNSTTNFYFNQHSLINYIIGFFWITLINYGILILYHFFTIVNLNFNPSKIDDFVDICSISNISLIILNNYTRGFYIHGKNPSDKSEGNLEEIYKALEIEGKGKTKGRGIIPNSEEQIQTFEIFLDKNTRNMLDSYNSKFNDLIIKENNSENINIIENQNNLDERNRYKIEFNEKLKKLLENISISHLTSVKQKDTNHRIFGNPPFSFEDLKTTLLYKDKSRNLSEILLMGIERDIIMLNTMILILVSYLTNKIIFGFLIIFLFTIIIVEIRAKIVKNNIEKKTLIDQSFLI